MTEAKNRSKLELRARITLAMQRDLGVSEQLAAPFVQSVMNCLAGERTYFPTPSRKYPTAVIKLDLEGGMSTNAVIKKYHISRSKLHALFPGGLPRPEASPRRKISWRR